MIDVLLPYYGDPALMREAVDSILAQEGGFNRLLIVDDCYPDIEFTSWLSRLEHPGVEYVRNESNLGANANYVKSLSLATADYVVFMGADDRMLPGFLARSRALIHDHSGPDIIQGGVRVINELGQPHSPLVDRAKAWCRPRVRGAHVLDSESVATSILRGNWCYFPSLVWRRETINSVGFRDFDVVQDLGLIIDVLRRNGRFVIDDAVTFEYRRHSGSDSSIKTATGSRFDEERAFYNDIAAELAHQGWPKAARAARQRLTSRAHAATYLPHALASRDGLTFRRLVRHAGSR